LAFMSNAEFPFHTFCTCCLLFALGVQRLYGYIAIEPYSSASVFVHRLCVCVRVSVCDVHICVHLYAGLFEYFITCWLNFHRILSVLFGYVLFCAPPFDPFRPGQSAKVFVSVVALSSAIVFQKFLKLQNVCYQTIFCGFSPSCSLFPSPPFH